MGSIFAKLQRRATLSSITKTCDQHALAKLTGHGSKTWDNIIKPPLQDNKGVHMGWLASHRKVQKIPPLVIPTTRDNQLFLK